MNFAVRNKIDRFLALAILFINGWNFTLPVISESVTIAMPIWFTPVQLIYGIFLHELLFLIYLGFLVFTRGGYLPVRQRDTRNIIFLLIVGMGCLGVLSNATNIQPMREMGEAGRLFLLGLYFLLVIRWAKKHGPTFVLRSLLSGVVSAGAINLYYSFTVRHTVLGGLPFLIGQNGPGGHLGISVVLGAWLMLERKTRSDATIAISACVIGLLGASISYSKLSMLMAGSGLIAWGFVVWRTLVDRRSRRLTTVMLAILFAVALANQERISKYVLGVSTFIHYKFIMMDERSIEVRSQYFIITTEIMSLHPLFGVGYGGFYNAAIRTEGYESPRSNEEYAEKGERGESNPHNSFLYYASANGLAGLLLAVLLFMMTSRAFWRTLSDRGAPGRVVWGCLVVAYFIFGMTLPTLFNTSILYLPTAVAVALSRQIRSRPSLIQSGAAAPIVSRVVT